MRRRLLLSVLIMLVPTSRTASAAPPPVDSSVALANHCFVIGSAGTGHRVSFEGASRFFLKPTALGRYLLYDEGRRLVGVRDDGTVGRGPGADGASPRFEWAIARTAPHIFSVRSPTVRSLTPGTSRYTFRRSTGCARFPEADVGADGPSFAGSDRRGRVFGWAETHLHITANQRAGGLVISGEPFDRFGIIRALGRDASVHGGDGSRDATGSLLRTGVPFGTHDTRGWPSFSGWPTFDTYTHQQTYWVWLQRAYKAGMRLVVAQTVEDDELCRLEPRRAHPCAEPATIALEVGRLRALQDYVDAQYGGRGRGWFRLVYGARQARRVIARGKLAVVIGVESSDPFGCGLRHGRSQCTRAGVDRGLERYHRLGVRSLFVAHWFDNAFGGAALEGGAKGKLINAMNRLRTGHYFRIRRCPGRGQGEEVVPLKPFEIQVLASVFPAAAPLKKAKRPHYPAGRRCNARGLTSLGEYLVRRMMAHHMLIEVDHLSERARDRVLAIAQQARYPLVSSHNGTGGTWTPRELRQLYALGGVASTTSGNAPELVRSILAQARYRSAKHFFGVGIGTDTGGFAALPGPRKDARLGRLRYPFRSYDGRVTFRRERTGRRVFDFNADGVAHYGLMADLIADVQRQPRGRRALASFFRSAEGYLQMWQFAARHR